MDKITYLDFDNLLSIFEGKETFEIEKWKNFRLNDLEKFKKDLKNKSEIYAIKDQNNCMLYIGKAKSIFGRLRSHFRATKGMEKAVAWKQFFEYFNSDLIVYYLVVDNFSEQKAEKARQIIERALQIKYDPLFEKIYYKSHKIAEDFSEKVKKYYNNYGVS